MRQRDTHRERDDPPLSVPVRAKRDDRPGNCFPPSASTLNRADIAAPYSRVSKSLRSR